MTLRFDVMNIEPRIWRVLRVPANLRLAELHRVLQMVMGWSNRHPHIFEIAGRAAGAPTRALEACSCWRTLGDENVTVATALASAPQGFRYSYDAPVGWRVRITRAPGVWRGVAKSSISCLDGYLAGPRDDFNGPSAYSAILAATLGRARALTAEERQWLGPNFDPELFDRCAINRALAQLCELTGADP